MAPLAPVGRTDGQNDIRLHPCPSHEELFSFSSLVCYFLPSSCWKLPQLSATASGWVAPEAEADASAARERRTSGSSVESYASSTASKGHEGADADLDGVLLTSDSVRTQRPAQSDAFAGRREK